jgi:hypothetical protein
MNHASEIFHIIWRKTPGNNFQNVNTATYSSLTLSKTERRYVTTTDGKKMLVWVVTTSILTKQKNIQHFYIVKVDRNRHWRNLLLPMEFTVDGC